MDLNNPTDQAHTRRYFKDQEVLVAVMAPTCGPFGPMGRLVQCTTPQAWERAYEDAAPHGRFCGEIAKLQLRKGLHFICEQPLGSSLYYV